MFKKKTTVLKYYLFAALGLAFWFIFPSLYASFPLTNEQNFYFEKIYLSEKFSFGIIEDIQEDRFGFIWIGSKDGLYRYDGINFTAYNYNREDTTSLSSNVVRELFLDKDGMLWVGTENGLNRYNDTTDAFERYFFGNRDDEQTANSIRDIVQRTSGELLIATIDGGLIQLNISQGTYMQYSDLPGELTLTSKYLRVLTIDQHGTLWLGSIDEGVEYTSDMSHISKLPTGPANGKNLAGKNIQCITEAPDGKLWIGTKSNGISVYNPHTLTFEYFTHDPQNPTSISSDNISFIFVDSQDRIWVGTDGGGLNLHQNNKQGFRHFLYQKQNTGGLSSNVPRVMYEDKAHNFWIGCFSGPLNYIDSHRKKFGLVRVNGPENGILNSNDISGLFVDSEGKIWIGNNGLSIYNPNTRKTDYRPSLPITHSAAKGNIPLSFDETENEIWIGLFEGGLMKQNKNTGSFTHFYPDGSEKMLRGYQVWDIYAEGDTVWLATERGLDAYVRSERKFHFFPYGVTDGSGTISGSIWKVMKDSRGRILVGTNEGLHILDRQSGKFSYFRPEMNDKNSLSDKWVLTLFEDSKNRIWIGTNGGGLNLWEEPANTFKCFNSTNGVSGNVINGILEDKEGNLWLTTNSGLTKFYVDELKFTTYDASDGLQSNRFNINTIARDTKGRFYMGGTNGLNIFYPSEIIDNDYTAPVYLTDFEVFNESVEVGSKASPFKQNFHIQKEIDLKYSDRVFTIHYAALSFTQPEKNYYKYKLEGFEEEWNNVGNQTEATYTNLSPGEYTFRIKASNNDKHWNDESTSLKITVHPPLYLTWWFIVFSLLLLGILIYLIYQNRVMNIRTLNQKLAELVAERTREIEKRNKEIAAQNQEIKKQRDIATSQRDQIQKQNEELEAHRHRLEELVEERTRELVAAKELAEESDKLKTAFLDNISHEIRTPMNAIVGFINLLGEKIDDQHSREYYMRIINDSSKNMLRLVQDVIDFSRMQTGQLQPEYNECNINELIREMVSRMRERASREMPGLNVLFDLPEKDIEMFTDDKKFVQILSKLIENAIKFTETGHIKVGVHRIEEKRISFYVEDTGPGIEHKHQDMIFDRFFSLDDEPRQESKSSGLGLAFAKLAVEIMGGEIWVESEVGKGSTFYFSIPFIQIMSETRREKSPSANKFYWPQSKILVAEDEESNFLLIEAIMKDTGVSLIHAMDGVELLEHINTKEKYDLILLDLKMPRMGGINAMKIIRESHDNVPVIVQTAYDQTNHRELCEEIGCNDFLVKPLRKMELLQTVKKYLG